MPASLKHVPLLDLQHRLRQSFWFIPLLMLTGALLLAAGTLWVDWNFDANVVDGVALLNWIQLGGADGARTLLTTVAGAVITVVGVIFSVTIAVLTLTSSQFGPRLLRTFIRDRHNHVVLGTFLATFLFCLLISLTIGDGDAALPRVSVLTGAALAVVSLLALVFFVHHVAQFIQADTVIENAALELDEVIDGLYAPGGERPDEARAKLPPCFDDEADVVRARATGYVTALDLDALLALAVRHDLRVELCRMPGAFVAPGDALARAAPRRRLDDACRDALRDLVYIGRARTSEQDLLFGIDQLVEIALRSMSTGLNDPLTATRAIDRLEAALRRLCPRVPPPSLRLDERGQARVVAPWPTIVDAVAAALGPLRSSAAGAPMVARRLIDAVAAVAPDAPDGRAIAALRLQLDGLREPVGRLDEVSRREAQELLDRAAKALDAASTRLERQRQARSPASIA